MKKNNFRPRSKPTGNPYIYVLVRRDLPNIVKAVQIGHACFEAGCSWPHLYKPNTNMVVLEVENQEVLLSKINELEETEKVSFEKFFEPDDNWGYTAACSNPVYEDDRKLFSNLKLLKI